MGRQMKIDFEWLEEKVFSRELSQQDRKTLSRVMTVEEFETGDTIIMEHEKSGSLYLLRSGCVDVLLGFDDQTLHFSNLEEGAQIGDMSFIDNAGASATIIAKEGCVAYRITRDAFTQLFVYHQSVARDLTFSIMRNMSGNLRRMNQESAAFLKSSIQ